MGPYVHIPVGCQGSKPHSVGTHLHPCPVQAPTVATHHERVHCTHGRLPFSSLAQAVLREDPRVRIFGVQPGQA